MLTQITFSHIESAKIQRFQSKSLRGCKKSKTWRSLGGHLFSREYQITFNMCLSNTFLENSKEVPSTLPSHPQLRIPSPLCFLYDLPSWYIFCRLSPIRHLSWWKEAKPWNCNPTKVSRKDNPTSAILSHNTPYSFIYDKGAWYFYKNNICLLY